MCPVTSQGIIWIVNKLHSKVIMLGLCLTGWSAAEQGVDRPIQLISRSALMWYSTVLCTWTQKVARKDTALPLVFTMQAGGRGEGGSQKYSQVDS